MAVGRIVTKVCHAWAVWRVYCAAGRGSRLNLGQNGLMTCPGSRAVAGFAALQSEKHPSLKTLRMSLK